MAALQESEGVEYSEMSTLAHSRKWPRFQSSLRAAAGSTHVEITIIGVCDSFALRTL